MQDFLTYCIEALAIVTIAIALIDFTIGLVGLAQIPIPPTPIPTPAPTPNLKAMNSRQLQELAKATDLPRWSSILKKDKTEGLRKALQQHLQPQLTRLKLVA